MEGRVTRRRFLKGLSVGAGLGLGGWPTRSARAAETLTIVTWGGPWFESAKQVAAKFTAARKVEVAWELHEGGAQKIVGKVKAAWPTVKYDLIAAWDPVFHAMMREDWLEPVDELPSLKDVPPRYLLRNARNQVTVAPMSVTVASWGYRKDMVDRPVTSFNDLLEPRFKGKVCMRNATSYSGLPFTSIALEFGGSERNIDPAFDFLKELARRGSIGRVAGSDIDAINSMTTGETSFGFGVGNVWERIAKAQPIHSLMRVPGAKGLKGLIYRDGWAVLKGPRAALAKEFANFSTSAENATIIAGALSAFPANAKAVPTERAKTWAYQPQELEQFAYFADFGHLSEQVSSWSARFEKEITPLLRRG